MGFLDAKAIKKHGKYHLFFGAFFEAALAICKNF